MTAELWPVPPGWWPAGAGAWPWDYRGHVAEGAIAAHLIAAGTIAGRAGAAAFIADTRRFIAETDAELRRLETRPPSWAAGHWQES